jgi:small GTP-binding protein
VLELESEEEEEDEDGVDLSPLKTLVSEPIIKLQIWDTAGRDSQFNAMTKQQFQEAYAAIVVYDMTSRETMRNAKKWIERIRENAPEDCLVVLLENKIDLKMLRDIKEDVGPQLAKREDALFKRVSAKSGEGIDELVMKLT